jgi:hypothetical protein
MSHVFISYNHIDTTQLNTLVHYLTENNINIWYDAHLEGGDNWRDEISVAIDEAYAMVIIVTQNMLNSHYCTYEWSYGMGTGIPVIPLIFEDVNITEIHAPLRNKQFVNCTKAVPEVVKTRLSELQREPIDVTYLRQKITKTIMTFRILMVTLIWYRNLPLPTNEKRKQSQGLGVRARDEAANLYLEILPEQMTIQSHAFTLRLKRLCRDLLDGIHQIHDELHTIVLETQLNLGEQNRLFEDMVQNYENMLAPLINDIAITETPFTEYMKFLNSIQSQSPNSSNNMSNHNMSKDFLFGVYLNDKDQLKLNRLINDVLEYLYPR